jgi:ComF family protein
MAFCGQCAESLLAVTEPFCPLCGLPAAAGSASHRCASCLIAPPPFSLARAPYVYGGALAEALGRFKYGHATWLSAPLGDLLASCLAATETPDVVVPVPLHPQRLRARGFNQSALLAGRISKRLKAQLDTASLRRTVDTPPQARLARKARLNALSGAFTVLRGRRLAGERVLLVDDVVTTTATVRAAAESLLRAGAAIVDVLSLARADWSGRVADRPQTG